MKTVRGATVRVSTAYLRVGPNESKGGRALLDKGRAAKVVGSKGDWLRLRLESGTEGWVRADLLKVKEKQFKIAQTAPKVKKAKAASKVAVAAHKAKAVKASKITRIAARLAVKAVKPVKSAKPSVKFAVHTAHSVPAAAHVDRAAHFDRAAQARIALRATLPQPHIAALAPVKAAKDEPVTLPIHGLVTANTPPEARRIEEVTDDAPTQDLPAPVRAIVADVRPQNLRGELRARTALGYRGAAYISGATGRGGFDCSGFMVFLFAREGVSLPRTAAEQFHAGSKVEKTDLRAGDMVFFKNTYKAGISHVGMYIGDGRFIHAANHRLGVKVDALSSSYYANHWAGARRAR